MVIRSLMPISMETTHDPKEHVLLIALKIMRHAKLCLSPPGVLLWYFWWWSSMSHLICVILVADFDCM